MNNRLIARIARQGGGKLLNSAVNRLFPAPPKQKGKKKDATRMVGGMIASTALTRVAVRSVPGAIVIGGGILAKKLYDRRRARLAEASPAESKSAKDGEADKTGNGEA